MLFTGSHNYSQEAPECMAVDYFSTFAGAMAKAHEQDQIKQV
jgi:hypothetical protein